MAIDITILDGYITSIISKMTIKDIDSEVTNVIDFDIALKDINNGTSIVIPEIPKGRY